MVKRSLCLTTMALIRFSLRLLGTQKLQLRAQLPQGVAACRGHGSGFYRLGGWSLVTQMPLKTQDHGNLRWIIPKKSNNNLTCFKFNEEVSPTSFLGVSSWTSAPSHVMRCLQKMGKPSLSLIHLHCGNSSKYTYWMNYLHKHTATKTGVRSWLSDRTM